MMIIMSSKMLKKSVSDQQLVGSKHTNQFNQSSITAAAAPKLCTPYTISLSPFLAVILLVARLSRILPGHPQVPTANYL
jgi:hypothetical protein